MSRPFLVNLWIYTATSSIAPVLQAAPALEEVIVTAQKVEETAQSVPISLQVLDSAALEQSRVTNITDLKLLVPSLRITPVATQSQSLYVVIRGIAHSAPELTQDPPTAIYLNGVYIARSTGLNFDTSDLERIEVLRGPQGTLYGRNATAGAISLVTAKPEQKFGFKQTLSTGSYGLFQSKTSLNVPLGEQLAAKLAYGKNSREGYVENSGPGKDFGDRDGQSLRFDVRWLPTDNLIVDYGYDWSSIDYVASPSQCLLRGGALSGGNVNNWSCNTQFQSTLATEFPLQESKTMSYGHTLNVEWVAGPLTLKSITGYRALDDRVQAVMVTNGNGYRLDAGASGSTALNIPGGFETAEQEQWSQELQLFGKLSDTLKYVAGVYYFRETGDSGKNNLHSLTVLNTVVPTGLMPLFPVPGTRLTTRSFLDISATNSSWAAFSQLTWTPEWLDRKLDVVAGIRYTRDKREAELLNIGETHYVNDAIGLDYLRSVSTVGGDASDSFSKTTPGLTLQYHWNEDLMAYAKIIKGYKTGGFSVRVNRSQDFANGFGPETLISYELGMKGDFFDRRLRVNAATFQYDYSDMQISQIVGTTPAGASAFNVLNAGAATLTGFELDITAALTERLRANLNYALLDGHFDKVENAQGQDITNQYYFGVPASSYTASVDYQFPSLSVGQLDFHINYSHIDSLPTNNNPSRAEVSKGKLGGGYVPAYGLLDARLALRDIGVGAGTLEVALWGKNLEDKRYLLTVHAAAPGAARAGWFGEPRTYGLDVTYRY